LLGTDTDPDPAKWCGSVPIRIHNTTYSADFIQYPPLGKYDPKIFFVVYWLYC
jgi:hypothetical protein